MQSIHFSFIIPVFNRPDETQELLQSFTSLETNTPFEIVIIEDGSTITSKDIVEKFSKQLNIAYFFKENTGPGDSRNFGMKHAKGNYFIILDSDCILPPHYVSAVEYALQKKYVDCFGGPDAAHQSFTNLQKAINFAMTSFITTGGIRGHKHSIDRFQPRSFNMGISKDAFEASNGFSNIHPGEDPDLSIRLKHLGFKLAFFEAAFVYHKRRISWKKFYIQVNKFGLVRPILNLWHPDTNKIVFWFPSLFCLGFVLSILLLFFNFKWLIFGYLIYFIAVFCLALVYTKSIAVAGLSCIAVAVQFLGYGYGFLKSTMVVHILKKVPQEYFPKLFFKTHHVK